MKLRVDDLTWREIDGDLVVLDLRSSTYLTANASGTVLMRHLAEGRTPDQLVEALVERFGIAQSQATQDVESFLYELGQHGLLEEPGRELQTDHVAPGGAVSPRTRRR
jgi:hypothetical protein